MISTSDPSMNIDTVTEADLRVLSQLYIDVFSAPPWNEHWELKWAEDRIKAVIQSDKFYGLKAEQNGIIVAACIGRLMPLMGKKDYDLVEFYVDAERQGQGIGDMLLNALEQQLIQMDCVASTLITSRSMPAFSFYSNRGFSTSDEMVFMSKTLKRK